MSITLQDREETCASDAVTHATVSVPRITSSRLSDADCTEFFRRLQSAFPAEHARIRDLLVMKHLPVVYHMAAKFANRGEPIEDLIQVGTLALIGAVDRYDPDRGVKFVTFAVPAIAGEIKRHFRDRSWALKVPRRLKELNGQLVRLNTELERQLGYAPSIQEIAAAAGATEEEAVQALELSNFHTVLSLDAPVDHTTAYCHGDLIGGEDPRLARVLDSFEVRQALEILGEKEREVIEMRFFQELSQSETAERMGISQMHVSRLQRRALSKLRDNLQPGRSA